MKDMFVIEYSRICNVYWLMRIPAWAVERGEFTNDDGDSYVPFDFATIVSTHDTRAQAEAALANVEV